MGRRSTKEERYIARQRLSQLTDDFNKKRELYNNFYSVVLDNKNIGFDELLKVLNEKLNIEFDYDKVVESLREINKYISPNKARELTNIFNLAIAIDTGNEEKIMIYTAKIKLMDEKRERLKQNYEDKRTSVEIKNQEKHNILFEESNKFMDKVINGDELTDADKEQYSKDILFIKKYLKEFDQEKYLEFIIKYNNIDPVSKEELEQLLEVVKYFRKNLKENKLKFELAPLGDDKDIEKVNKIKFLGEEDLDESTRNYPKRLYAWKLSRIKKEQRFYEKFEELLEKLIESENFDCYKLLTPTEKSTMSTDYEFISDMFNRIKTIDDVYKTSVKGIQTINENDYKNLKSNYKKRVLKKSNN